MTNALRYLMTTILLTSWWALTSFADDIRVESEGKVYVGDHGVKVSIVPVKPRKTNQVLILFNGTDSEVDGAVLLHTVNEWDKNKNSFRTQWQGKEFTTIYSRDAWWSAKQYMLNVPGKSAEVAIFYDEKKSEALKSDEILNKYLGRKTASTGFDRSQETAREDKAFKEVVSAVNKSCDSQIAAEIDWKSVQDDVLKSTEVAGACGSVLSALEKFCDFEEGKKTIRNKVKKVTCSFGDKLGISVSSGKMTWTTAKDTPNQVDFARSYIEKNL